MRKNKYDVFLSALFISNLILVLYIMDYKFISLFLKYNQEDMKETDENNMSSNIAYQSSNTTEMKDHNSNGLCGTKRSSDSVEMSESKKGSDSLSSDSENVDQSDQEDVDHSADEFHCTACDMVPDDVYTHPLLKVIVCRNCKYRLQERMRETVGICSYE